MCKGIILLIQSPPDPGIGLLQIKQHFFFLFSFLYFIPFFNNFLSYKVFFWWIHLTIGLLVNCPFSIHEWILVLSSLNIKKNVCKLFGNFFSFVIFLSSKIYVPFLLFFFFFTGTRQFFFNIVLVLTLASTYNSLDYFSEFIFFFLMHSPVFLQRPLLYKYLILNVSYFSWLVLQI